MDFAHYQFPKLLGLSPLLQVKVACLENRSTGFLESPMHVYWQNLGWLAKSKIPDRLESSQHMD